jgi:hypothetical protein
MMGVPENPVPENPGKVPEKENLPENREKQKHQQPENENWEISLRENGTDSIGLLR